ncbi:fused chemotaxis regulator; protein-glutamat [Legionella wadsworthii]|uniref:protein-glutamate methylesterase n=1 Tax=Legionella wadsworthii TaxID=28088 RepID=A0A378LZZ5_9GAMM
MENNHLVVIGASAGGIKPLIQLISSFPDNFRGIILIVLHLSPNSESKLPNIIQRHTSLKVRHPREIEELTSGHVYIAPPNLHMTLMDGKVTLRQGPKINNTRPAIDVLFYSAALYYGPLVIGILLSGLLDDGSAGFSAIKKCKGTTIAQSPEEADFPDMPKNAIKAGVVDYQLKLEQIYPLIKKIINSTPSEENSKSELWETLRIESQLNDTENLFNEDVLRKISTPSTFTCPECSGILWQIKDKSILRWRCRVGHAYGKESLFRLLKTEYEDFLWKALRCLEEKEELLLKNLKLDLKEEDLNEELDKIKRNKYYLIKMLSNV